MDRTRSIHTLTAIASSREFLLGYCADGWPGLAGQSSREYAMADAINDSAGRNDVQGGRRPRQGARRPYGVEFSLTAEGFELLEAAAERAGQARGAYAAEAALAAARGGPVAADSPLRELLRELIRASGLVRRIGVNLNQAVAKLNATGQRSGDLLPYAAESLRHAERLDAVADEARKALR
jgi:hypothetical protein